MSTQMNIQTGGTTSLNITSKGTIEVSAQQKQTEIAVSDPSGYSQENIEDITAALIVAGESIRKQYDDENGTLTIGLSGTISGGDSTQW